MTTDQEAIVAFEAMEIEAKKLISAIAALEETVFGNVESRPIGVIEDEIRELQWKVTQRERELEDAHQIIDMFEMPCQHWDVEQGGKCLRCTPEWPYTSPPRKSWHGKTIWTVRGRLDQFWQHGGGRAVLDNESKRG